MPKEISELENKLTRQVKKRHPEWTQERKERYVYGTIRKVHPEWKPSHQRKMESGR